MEQDFNIKHWSNSCPKYDCRKNVCKCGLKYVNIPLGLSDEFAPTKGLYCNAIVEYEDTGDVYVYTKDGIPVALTGQNVNPLNGRYSLQETDSGERWIDGAKIYRKTFNMGALPNNRPHTIPHGISGLKSVIRAEGAAAKTIGAKAWITTSNQQAGAYPTILVSDTNVGWVTREGAGDAYDESYITLYYTKEENAS